MIRQFALTIRFTLLCLGVAVIWQPPSGVAQSPEVQLERQDIRQVQETLNALGFDAGPSDGLMGPQTRSAIQAFRASRGYEIGAPIGQTLLSRLAEVQTDSSQDSETDEATAETEPPAPSAEEAEQSDDTLSEDASVTTPAETEQPEATDTSPAGPKLIDTRWRFIDDNGATMEATFRSNGRIERQGRIDSDWSWTREGRSLVIEFNSGVGLTSTREGRLVDPQAMRGTGTSSTGGTWTWEAERLDNGSTPSN